MINIARRRIMGGGSASLPYDAEIEYLESTGTQWIDTDIYLGESMDSSRGQRCDIDMSFMLTKSISSTSYILGAYSTAKGTPRVQLGINKTTSKFTGNTISVVSGLTIGDVIALNTPYNVQLYNTNTYNQAWISVGLFALRGDASATQHIDGMRLYSCTMSKNGSLVRDFIPVRVGQVGYLYDKVSGELFGNSGTGDFVLGPDKN